MARNEEKAQSMLYRFREAQAAELGLANNRTDRRPRLASMCTTLRECERWRGEILREISRKVSKIQDAHLTDYEIRDLNDEINKLMREKNHWERQIVSLGGANYRRSTAMVGEDGKEVPGTRGYKYFGRAKELPGVKEMFAKSTENVDEETARSEMYRRFRNQGPEYYGDVDEVDPTLDADEEEGTAEDWSAATKRIAELLGLPEDSDQLPVLPTPSTQPPPQPAVAAAEPASIVPGKKSKRKAKSAPEESEDVEMSGEPSNKEAKLTTDSESAPASIAAFLSVLSPDSMKAPEMLSKEEMEKVLLEARKKLLMEEYLGKV